MKLNGQQRTILREGILGAYPTEDELKILLLEKMNLNLEEFNRGESYNPKISNLIIQLEADGKLKDCIRIIVKEKPNSPDLEKVKSEFKTAIEDDNQISETNNFMATTTDTGICPYKGLRYFDCNEEDSKYFHGRENLTDELLPRMVELG
jgi:hypothetical protein